MGMGIQQVPYARLDLEKLAVPLSSRERIKRRSRRKPLSPNTPTKRKRGYSVTLSIPPEQNAPIRRIIRNDRIRSKSFISKGVYSPEKIKRCIEEQQVENERDRREFNILKQSTHEDHQCQLKLHTVVNGHDELQYKVEQLEEDTKLYRNENQELQARNIKLEDEIASLKKMPKSNEQYAEELIKMGQLIVLLTKKNEKVVQLEADNAMLKQDAEIYKYEAMMANKEINRTYKKAALTNIFFAFLFFMMIFYLIIVAD